MVLGFNEACPSAGNARNLAGPSQNCRRPKHGFSVEFDLFNAAAPNRMKVIVDVLTASIAIVFLALLIWKVCATAMVSLEINQGALTAIVIPIDLKTFKVPLSGYVVLLLVLAIVQRHVFRDLRIAARRGELL